MNIPAAAIHAAVVPQLPGFTVEVVPRIASTNSELMRRARSGQTGPVLLVAREQTAGRGRLGRSWHSGAISGSAAPADAAYSGAADGTDWPSLTFSVGMTLAPADWSGLSLALGVSLAESLDPAIGLKWPNDLWWQDRKLGGILIETATPADPTGNAAAPEPARGARQVVIGVGINIAQPVAQGLSTAPAWLRELWPQADAGQVLLRIAAPLVNAVLAFEHLGFAAFQARFEARDVLRDRAVVLSDGSTGTAHGVTETGGLLVHTALGMTTITSAEVSARPA